MIRKRARRPPEAGRALALAALFLLVGAGRAPVLAAPVDPDLSTDGLRRAGPFHLRPYVLLKDAGYDDNIRFDAAARRGDRTATAGLALDGLLLFGDRGGLRFNQELDYVAFGRETDLNHWNGSARARGLLKVRKALLFLEDRFGSVRERPNTEIDQRLRRDSNAVTAGIRSLREGRLGYRASVRRESIEYASGEPGTEAIVRRLSRDESALVVTGELRVRPKTTLLLEGAVEEIAFEDPAESRDARARSLLPGVRFDPSAAIQGEFRLGRIALDSLDRPGGDFDGTIGWGAVSARVGAAGRLKTRFRRDVEFSARTES
ncbi:MAG: outer membrane beta-barrel protein, partial [Candidatus Polarisedimenticolia bacterium]